MNSHKPIQISHVSVSFLHKTCFEDFSAIIYSGDHIALIGDNGSGKSTLLSLLSGTAGKPHEGSIILPPDIVVGYLPQDMHLDQHKTVWQTATEGVEPILENVRQFELLAKQVGQSDAIDTAYDLLFEKLVASDAFAIENKITTLLQHMGLASKKHDLVSTLSGGQQVLLGLVRIVATSPDLLLLDEPTNHLDKTHREKLFSFLQAWKGAAIIISHDMQLLRTWPEKIWAIRHSIIDVFDGNYTDYIRDREIADEQQSNVIEQLQREKKKLAKAKEDDREREARSKKVGEKKYANTPKVVRRAKEEQAAKTTGKKQSELQHKQEIITQQLQRIHEQKVITPKFDMSGKKQYGSVFVQDGAVGYGDHVLVHDINFIVQPGERVAFVGDNGAGKSTIFKAIMDGDVLKKGEWRFPPQENIGHLDQKYSILQQAVTPFELIKSIQKSWNDYEIRDFLNDFLFSKNEEVGANITTLSGGEKARLALAYICAQSPSVLLLDEVTNNVDITTRNHIITVLNQFPGTILVISHDYDFLHAVGVKRAFAVGDGALVEEVI